MKKILFGCFSFLLSLVADAESELTRVSEGHVDLSWSYSNGVWTATVSDEDRFPPVIVSPGEAVLVGKDKPFPEEGSRLIRPESSQWDITGAAAGEPVWVMPVDNMGHPVVEPGFNTGGISPGIAKSPIRIDLLGVEHADGGDFTLFTILSSIHMASSDGIDGNDFYFIGAGDHRHVFWVFSKRGLYRITFRASMLLVAGDESSRSFSEPETFSFAIGLGGMENWLLDNGVVPELWGDNDSPAGDGVPNLLKYALGLPPLETSSGALGSLGFVEEDGDRHFAVSFSLNPDAEGIARRVEVSDDLKTWRHGEGHTVMIFETSGFLQVRDALPEGPAQPRRFLRLAVERAQQPEDDDDF